MAMTTKWYSARCPAAGTKAAQTDVWLRRGVQHAAGVGRRSKAKGHRLSLWKVGLGVVYCVFGFLMVANAIAAGEMPAEISVDAFIDHYFSSWSNRDMGAYKDCFHPQANIVFLDRTNNLHASFSLDAFVRTQEEAHQKSLVSMREIPLNKRITIAGKMSQAAVRWKLTKGRHTVTGVDLFTLVSTSGQWKILYLAVRTD